MSAPARESRVPDVVDPRPRVDGNRVLGLRCQVCGYPSAQAVPRCPLCGGDVEPAAFGPGGTVWSATVLYVPVGVRTPPFALAFVDLDEGPRVLARLEPEVRIAIGDRVQVTGTVDGDVLVERA